MTEYERFIKEKRYCLGVTERTEEWYRYALSLLPNPNPTQAELKSLLLSLCDAGRSEVGINSARCAINSYLHWLHAPDTTCSPQCKHPKLSRVKEPKTVLPTYSSEQLKTLIRWKPRLSYEKRLHLLILILLDTGARITEALSLKVSAVDLDNMLITLDGKGRKQRIVPMSIELRKAINKHIKENALESDVYLLATRDGTQWAANSAHKGVRRACLSLGFTPPKRIFHSMRHSYALNYVRKGGSVFHLQKSLGHSTLEMCRRYTNLVTDDLQAIHRQVSLLSVQSRAA